MGVVSGEVSAVESTSIVNLLGGFVPGSHDSLAAADASWLGGVMISNLVVGTVEVFHVESFLNLIRLDVGSGWALRGSSESSDGCDEEFEHFLFNIN